MHANVLGLNTFRQQLLSYTCSLSSVCITRWRVSMWHCLLYCISLQIGSTCTQWGKHCTSKLSNPFSQCIIIICLGHNTSNPHFFLWVTRKRYFPRFIPFDIIQLINWSVKSSVQASFCLPAVFTDKCF